MFKSLKSVTIPAKIGHKNNKTVTNVIDNELPLLLSKKEMKISKAKIDFDNDIIYKHLWTRYKNLIHCKWSSLYTN